MEDWKTYLFLAILAAILLYVKYGKESGSVDTGKAAGAMSSYLSSFFSHKVVQWVLGIVFIIGFMAAALSWLLSDVSEDSYSSSEETNSKVYYETIHVGPTASEYNLSVPPGYTMTELDGYLPLALRYEFVDLRDHQLKTLRKESGKLVQEVFASAVKITTTDGSHGSFKAKFEPIR
ncbi:hypothetical protein GW765_00705 [Candidatus Parcubacteria bacterium]|nr:hypothetical protein [Candidatus Parcubacteria bacterium]